MTKKLSKRTQSFIKGIEEVQKAMAKNIAMIRDAKRNQQKVDTNRLKKAQDVF